ncbi:O-antigen ligase family protein [Pendulispora rubella]|uniref:O-antigen ligase family protein n=1 Tax=Pendulispora rubella TaxID=2741070 RepID=UPI0030E540C7
MEHAWQEHAPSSGSRSHRVKKREEWTLRVGRWLLAGAVLFPALALGAIHTSMLLITSALVGLSGVLVWMHAPVARPRLAASVLVATCVGLTLFTAFQLLPLPAGLLHLVAPRNADVWARAFWPLHLPGPGFASISLDPVASGVEVLRGVTYLVAFLSVVRISASRHGALFCSAILVVSATAVGAAALAHPALGAERVFGIYRPTTLISARHVATILNANALAAYINIGFFVALGEGLASRPAVPRPISLAFAGVLMAFEFWLASRGGVLACIAGAGLLVWMTRVSSRSHRHSVRRVTYAVLVALLVACVGMWVFASSDDAWNELADRDLSKLRVFEYAARMVWHHFFWGTGRGSFESTFPAFRDGTTYVTYTHPENVLLQWASEWGVPVTLAALGAIAWALRPSVLFSRSRPAVGAWVAIVTSFLHNLVDFNSEFPAIVLALSVCAGVIVGGTGVGAFRRIDVWAKRPRLLAWTAAGVMAVTGAFVLVHVNDDLYSDRAKLHDASLKPETPDEFRSLAQGAISRHPSEPYLPFSGSVRAWVAGDESVLPWVSRSLELSPVYGPAHLILARTFFRAYPSQARLEYRYAIQQASEWQRELATEAGHLVTGPEEALELVPDGALGLSVLQTLANRLGERLPATQAALDEEILRRKSDATDAIGRRTRALLTDLADSAISPWCAESNRTDCIDRAIEGARRLQQLKPTVCEGFELEARARAESGDVDNALRQLEGRAELVDDKSQCLDATIKLAKRFDRAADMTGVIDKLAKSGCANDDRCADLLLYVGRIEEQRGNLRRALMFFRRARERYTSRDDVVSARAHTAARLGLHAEALDEFAELAKRHPDNPDWAQKVTHERQAMIEPARGKRP